MENPLRVCSNYKTMNTITLNPALKKIISRDVGMPFDEIKRRTAGEIDEHIERKSGRKIRIGFNYTVCGRGSVYMALKRFIGFDKKGNITCDYEQM